MKDIVEDFQKKLSVDYPNLEIEDEIKFPENTILQDLSGQNIAQVVSIKIAGKLTSSIHKSEIHGENSVWLIMQSIFEDKIYTVSK